jgi:mannonate dehydratase
MSRIMRALVEVQFDGIVILDHTPALAGGGTAPMAYGLAYMTALLHAATAGTKG